MKNVCKIARHEAERRACFRLRAQLYGHHYSNIPREGFDDTIDHITLANDSPQAYTVYASGPDGAPVGTVRLSLAHHPTYVDLTIETEKLMVTDYPLLDHLQRHTDGFPAQPVVGEMGKLAIQPEADTLDVIETMRPGVASIIQHFGLNSLVAISSPMVIYLLKRVGMPFYAVPGARLRREDPEVLRLIVSHYDYFLPKLKRRLPPEEIQHMTDCASYEQLYDLVAGVPDGVGLYWTPAATITRTEAAASTGTG